MAGTPHCLQTPTQALLKVCTTLCPHQRLAYLGSHDSCPKVGLSTSVHPGAAWPRHQPPFSRSGAPNRHRLLLSQGSSPAIWPISDWTGGWLLLCPPPTPTQLPAISTQGLQRARPVTRSDSQGLCPTPPPQLLVAPAACPPPPRPQLAPSQDSVPALPEASGSGAELGPGHITTPVAPCTWPAHLARETLRWPAASPQGLRRLARPQRF